MPGADTARQQDPRSAARRAALVDLASGVVMTMLVWPFPVMRRVFTVPVHIVLIVVGILVVGAVVHFGSVSWKHRTLGMYFAGLRLAAIPGPVRLAVWSTVRSLLLPLMAVAPGAGAGAVVRLTRVDMVEE